MTKTTVTFLAVILIAIIGGVAWWSMSGTSGTVVPSPAATSTGQSPIEPSVTQPTTTVLNLSGQGLTQVPAYVFMRTDLTELDLSSNTIGGALQAEIRNLKNLKILNLSNNKFTGVPAEIGQLQNLEVLNLSHNLVTGLPLELGNLKNLKLLDLTGNNFSASDLSTIREGLPSSTVVKTQ